MSDKVLSREAIAVLTFMYANTSGPKYLDKKYAEGLYLTTIKNYGLEVPKESKDDIINKFFEIMESHH